MYEANLFFACINTLHVFKELWHLYLFIIFLLLITYTYVLYARWSYAPFEVVEN